MKALKVLTAADFVHSDLKEGRGFTVIIVHTNLAGTASRPDEYHDDEARTFLAAVVAAAQDFPEIEVVLLDSIAHPSPAKLLSACLFGSAECEALLFIGSSYAGHRAVCFEGETKESLRAWLLGLSLARGPRQASSLDEALLWLAFNLAQPPNIDFDESRWDDTSIRARAIAAVSESMKTLHQNWYPWLELEGGSRADPEEG